MKQVNLTRGFVAIVDDDDYERVIGFKWFAHEDKTSRTIYAVTNIRLPNGQRTSISLHRFLMGNPKGFMVDHRDCNGLNCIRENMRLCDRRGNRWNRRRDANNSSGYIGVSWATADRKWRAAAETNGKTVYLGVFNSPEDAARAYDERIKVDRGEFAVTNFP